ncbi:MAG: CarD family transcriptional regulator [Pseudomonadota bacterium]
MPVRTMAPASNGKPAMPQPPIKMSNFSTTANPAKSAGNSKIGFKVNEYIVYPTHGVGQITAIEEQLIAGLKLELFVVFFAKDRMTLRVPVGKIVAVGMRKISETGLVAKAVETLKGRPRIKRTMWSRRAQEYEAKINSGDIISIAEVVRDLFRADTQPEQSYSERQLYEAALDRMVREVAVVNKTSDTEAQHMIEAALQKSPRRRAATSEDNVVAFKKADNDDSTMGEEKAA